MIRITVNLEVVKCGDREFATDLPLAVFDKIKELGLGKELAALATREDLVALLEACNSLEASNEFFFIRLPAFNPLDDDKLRSRKLRERLQLRTSDYAKIELVLDL